MIGLENEVIYAHSIGQPNCVAENVPYLLDYQTPCPCSDDDFRPQKMQGTGGFRYGQNVQ